MAYVICMTNRPFLRLLRLSSRLRQFNRYNMSPKLYVFILSVSDENYSPALNHFELIDFAFVVGVPGRIIILKGPML